MTGEDKKNFEDLGKRLNEAVEAEPFGIRPVKAAHGEGRQERFLPPPPPSPLRTPDTYSKPQRRFDNAVAAAVADAVGRPMPEPTAPAIVVPAPGKLDALAVAVEDLNWQELDSVGAYVAAHLGKRLDGKAESLVSDAVARALNEWKNDHFKELAELRNPPKQQPATV